MQRITIIVGFYFTHIVISTIADKWLCGGDTQNDKMKYNGIFDWDCYGAIKFDDSNEITLR